jgi:hypothetical protein
MDAKSDITIPAINRHVTFLCSIAHVNISGEDVIAHDFLFSPDLRGNSL